MKRTPLEQALADVERYHDFAVSAYRRYCWRPGTASGNKDRALYERHEEKFTAALERVRELTRTTA
jgi:hypothetical protein